MVVAFTDTATSIPSERPPAPAGSPPMGATRTVSAITVRSMRRHPVAGGHHPHTTSSSSLHAVGVPPGRIVRGEQRSEVPQGGGAQQGIGDGVAGTSPSDVAATPRSRRRPPRPSAPTRLAERWASKPQPTLIGVPPRPPGPQERSPSGWRDRPRHGDHPSVPFDQRRLVGGILVISGLGGDQGRHPEALRGLRGSQTRSGPRSRRPDRPPSA